MTGGRIRRSTEATANTHGDATSTLALNVVGVVLIAVAWFGASGQTKVASAFPYINLGVAGVLVVAVGNTIYLYGFRRAVRNRLAQYRQLKSPGSDRRD